MLGNRIKTTILVVALISLFMGIGYIIGNKVGLLIAFIIGMSLNFFSYWYSDKIILSLYHAKPLPNNHYVSRTIKDLAIRAGLPIPKAYIIETSTPNAFATGRDPRHSAIAVTTGLLELLDEDEIKGVIGHELMHIKHRDTLLQTIVIGITSAISLIANILQWSLIFGANEEENSAADIIVTLLIILLAPILATLIQLAISRNREFMADEGSARILHNSSYLIRALEKLEKGVISRPLTDTTKIHTSSLFIVNPFRGSFSSLFSTHPPTKERIRRLKRLRL